MLLIIFEVHIWFRHSPSDLDADFEDNQDYDSTVSQSETKLPTFNPELACMGLSDALAPPSSGSRMTNVTADYQELRQVNTAEIIVSIIKRSVFWQLADVLYDCTGNQNLSVTK